MTLPAGTPNLSTLPALAYLVEHGVSESIVAALLAAGPRSFADDAAWQVHLDRCQATSNLTRYGDIQIYECSRVNRGGRAAPVDSAP